MQDSFIMYASFHEALKALSLEQYGRIMYAINEYALNDKEIELSPIEKMAFTLIKPQLDANKKRYNDGKKGGRPNKITTVENEDETEKPMVIENEKKEKPVVFNFSENKKPNNNVNVNDNSNLNENVNLNLNENVEIVSQSPTQKQKRFEKPTREKVAEYCKERENFVDPDVFIDYYNSKGWKIGNAPMKDWKAAVRTWERRSFNNASPPPQNIELEEKICF